MKQPNLLTKSLRLTLVIAATAGLLSIVALTVGLIPSQRVLPALVAHAQGTINVTTNTDEYGTNPGACSLREAVQSVNTNASFGGCTNPGGADTIQLDADTYTLSILASGTPSNDGNGKGRLKPETSMTILGTGSGQTVISTTSTFNDWVFDIYTVTAAIAVSMEGLTVQGGDSGGIQVRLFGSGAANSTFSFTDMIVQNNQGSGMRFYVASNNVKSTLTDVVIRNNQSSGIGGGILGQYGGKLVLNKVTINDNQAGSSGGGIYYGNQYGTDALQMTNVTIYDNTAQTSGGGLYLSWATSGGGVAAINVTIADNQAIGGSGGNIYNYNSTVEITNTIVANGVQLGGPNNCAGNPGPNITSGGNNLDSGDTCGLSATGDITDTNPLLDAALADNGGSTPTVALLDGSPAIDAGTNVGCPATDQRGFPRTAICDIGAYEYYGQQVYLPLILKED